MPTRMILILEEIVTADIFMDLAHPEPFMWAYGSGPFNSFLSFAYYLINATFAVAKNVGFIKFN